MTRMRTEESRSAVVTERRTLEEEHLAIEARLAELDRHISLTAEEQVERARLKKLKLATKDRMARLGSS